MDYYTGNSAVDFSAPFPVQQQQYADLITVVRDVVADKLNRTFIMRKKINAFLRSSFYGFFLLSPTQEPGIPLAIFHLPLDDSILAWNIILM